MLRAPTVTRAQAERKPGGADMSRTLSDVGDKVGKLNVDDAQDVATRFGITSIPRVFIFKSNTAVQKITGLTSERELTKLIDAALKA